MSSIPVMMRKQVLAVDIDDVLASTTEEFVAYSNKRWGTRLTVDDYTEDWAELWQLGYGSTEVEQRAEEVHAAGLVGLAAHKDGAYEALARLRPYFHVVLVTSRRRRLAPETEMWLEKKFAGLYDDIVYAGIYDAAEGEKAVHHERIGATKKAILEQIKADYFIDDQPKHCAAAGELGIKTILFGDYSWNQSMEITPGITRCVTWYDVEKYFESQVHLL